MLNFRKISAIGVSALMFGLTAGTAAAANYPSPFVVGGNADVAIVYGTGTGVSVLDAVEAGNIQSNLQSFTTGTGSGGTSSIEGDGIQLQRSTDKFNLGDNMSAFYSTLDSEELTVVLKDGVYYNDANEDFEYEQELTLPTTTQMTHFRHRDYNDYEPTIGFQFARGDAILNYTLEFTPNDAEGSADLSDFSSTFVEILGKEYFISTVTASGDEWTMTLLDSASKTTLNQGESTTVTVDGTAYTISIQAISSTGAILVVNGETTNRLNSGDTQKLSGGTGHIGVTDFQAAAFQGDTAFVEFSLGTGEIVLEDGTEVEINGDAVSQIDRFDDFKLNSYIVNATTNIESITLEWLADDDVFLTSGNDLVMPGFGGVKLSMNDFVVNTRETVTFNAGDPFSLTTNVKNGPVTLDLFYLNSTENGFGSNLGTSATQHLITNETGGPNSVVALSLVNETYFVASWISGRDSETYVYELTNLKNNNGKNETTLTSLSGGSNIVFSEVTDNKDVGRLRLTLDAANVIDETATVRVTPVSGGDVYTDRVFTAEGLQFKLPVSVTNSSSLENGVWLGNSSSPTAANTTFSFNFTEEDRDGNVASGSSFQIGVSIDSDDGIEGDVEPVEVTMLQIGRTGDAYVGYVQSDLASMVEWTKDSSGLDAMRVTYHGSEASAAVFVGELDATLSGGSSGGSASLGEVLVKDTEVSSVSSKNLIVVGGSCINSVAARVLGSGCGASFTQTTGVGSGQFLIQSVGDVYSTGKVALVVAGYEVADTANAAKYLRTQSIDTAAGKKYIGTTSTSAELQVA
ncbi:MAG: hypothetical protein WDZ77_00345 [Candidatus Pacearchaeota archaeon]